jgi:hypothetical protein
LGWSLFAFDVQDADEEYYYIVDADSTISGLQFEFWQVSWYH